MASILILAFFSISFTRLDDGMVRGRRAVNALMDSVEFSMDDHPSYADSLIKRIDPNSIRNKRQKARYALLYTAAEYKNYQPFTTDSLIMEAVSYYSHSQDIDYRFLSYYYLGCVYIEMDRLKDASVALAQAERLVDRIDNDYWKGLLYGRLGVVFFDTYDYCRSKDYFSKAESCFKNAGKEYHRLYALYNLSRTLINIDEYNDADSLLRIVEQMATDYGDSALEYECVFTRLSCLLNMNESDSVRALINQKGIDVYELPGSFCYYGILALYYNQINNYAKAELYMNEAEHFIQTMTDSIYWSYYNYLLYKNNGQIEEAFEFFRELYTLQMKDLRSYLNEPILSAQYDDYRSVTELESVKARNKITILVASIIIIVLIVFFINIYNRNKKREFENQISDYISTINELTTQISINQDKIGNLNAKVREMLRQQFNPSDYLYTRYYEQIDDNKKAERLYRVVKSQLDGFKNQKNLCRIDELLDEAFDGIMKKITSSGIEIKEKDLLLLRFVLAGFSAKSIAALLDDTHQNINQRKKRMLDKIQANAPDLMDELRIALNNR